MTVHAIEVSNPAADRSALRPQEADSFAPASDRQDARPVEKNNPLFLKLRSFFTNQHVTNFGKAFGATAVVASLGGGAFVHFAPVAIVAKAMTPFLLMGVTNPVVALVIAAAVLALIVAAAYTLYKSRAAKHVGFGSTTSSDSLSSSSSSPR